MKVAQKEYTKVVSEHFDYLSNVVYDLKKKDFRGQYMSTKHIEKIISLFAWFYKRLFNDELEEYRKEQRDKRNARRKKSTAFEKRKAVIKECKKNGLNKTETADQTRYSYPTVLKYWDLS